MFGASCPPNTGTHVGTHPMGKTEGGPANINTPRFRKVGTRAPEVFIITDWGPPFLRNGRYRFDK